MSNLEELLKKTYNLVNFTNRNNFIMEDWSMEPFKSLSSTDRRNIEIIQTPEIVEKENRGSCYDQTFLVKNWLNEIGMESRMFYSITDNVQQKDGIKFYSPSVTSHVFIILNDKHKWKWIEWSWYANIRNSFDNENIMEVLKQYQMMAERSWHHQVSIYEIKEMQLPITRLEFLNKCLSFERLSVK